MISNADLISEVGVCKSGASTDACYCGGLPQHFSLDCLISRQTNSLLSRRHILQIQAESSFFRLEQSNITSLPRRYFSRMNMLKSVYIHETAIESITDKIFEGLVRPIVISLSDNRIQSLPQYTFKNMSKLRVLSLANNTIGKIHGGTFKGLRSLILLRLDNNNIRALQDGTFHELSSLKYLNISTNQISYIHHDDFQMQSNLISLDISYNPVIHIASGAFRNLRSLKYAILVDIYPGHVEPDTMVGMYSLEKISTSDTRLCCLLDDVDGLKNVTCARTSPTSPLDTCGRLYPSVVLRIAGWIIGLTSLIGNFGVLILRFREDRQMNVQTLLIINLAIADCLMGIYMIIITSADVHYGSKYFLRAPMWRESLTCRLSSVLAFLSSECSVLTLTLITIDRFICIMFPFGEYRLNVKRTVIIVSCLWISVFVLSLAPLVMSSSELSSFYGLSDVCIGLPLHVESGQTGRLEVVVEHEDLLEITVMYVPTDKSIRPWIYSIIIFIGANMFLFVFILTCYCIMFIQVKRSTSSVGCSNFRDREIKVARKMAFIVGTDFACWMPIIVMGILTQSGLVVLPTSLYAWSVIFIIPINSSINPILYTFVNYLENRKNLVETRSNIKNVVVKSGNVSPITFAQGNSGMTNTLGKR